MNKAEILFAVTSFVFLLSISTPSPPLYANTTSIAPDKDILVIDSDKVEIPDWKRLLDKARSHIAAGDIERAIPVYEELLQIKPNIEVAKWEYSRALNENGDYGEALNLLQSLVDNNPDIHEYALQLGIVLNVTGNQHKAFQIFGSIYNKYPFSDFSEEALWGMINSLELQKKFKLTIPLLEQLIKKSPDRDTYFNYAKNLAVTGQKEKSRKLFQEIVNKFELDEEQLLVIDSLFEYPEDASLLILIWERYLLIHEDFIKFHRKLEEHYNISGVPRDQLAHLLWLDNHEYFDGKADKILEIGDIYLHSFRDADKALAYYERYNQLKPGNQRVEHILKSAQAILAYDFLAIVKNGGADLLWQDLEKITPERKTLFLIMAEILNREGDTKTYITVLSILHEAHPDDQEIILLITESLVSNKNLSIASEYLKKIPTPKVLPEKYYYLQYRIHKGLGNSLKAQKAAENILKLSNQQLDPLVFLFNESIKKPYSINSKQYLIKLEQLVTDPQELFLFQKNYVAYLQNQGLFGRALSLLNKLEDRYLGDERLLKKIKLLKAELYNAQGRTIKAEQEYLEILNQYPRFMEGYLALIKTYSDNKKTDIARGWLECIKGKASSWDDGNMKILTENEVLFLESSFLVSEKRYQDLFEFLKVNKKKLSGKKTDIGVYQEYLALALYKTDQFKECYEVCLAILSGNPENKQGLALLYLLDKEGLFVEKNTPGGITHYLNSNEQRLNTIIEGLFSLGLYESGAEYVGEHISLAEKDIVNGYHYQRILLYAKKGQDARRVLNVLRSIYPGEMYFIKQINKVEFLAGDYEKVIDGVGRLHQDELREDIFQTYLLASAFWALGNMEQSQVYYKDIMQPNVELQLKQRILEYNLLKIDIPADDFFWDNLIYTDSKNIKASDVIMEPSFFILNEQSVINDIAVGLYTTFAWQKNMLKDFRYKK